MVLWIRGDGGWRSSRDIRHRDVVDGAHEPLRSVHVQVGIAAIQEFRPDTSETCRDDATDHSEGLKKCLTSRLPRDTTEPDSAS